MWRYILIVLFIIALPIVGSLLTTPNLEWYNSLNLPAITPSGAFIGGVWTVLFILLGIAMVLYWRKSTPADRLKVTSLLVINGVLNVGWSYLFFYRHAITSAFAEIWVLNISILALIWILWRYYRTSSYLLVPYLLWVSFATYLNYLIWRLN